MNPTPTPATTGHTELPWRLHDMEHAVVVDSDGRFIADFNAHQRDEEENAGNAGRAIESVNAVASLRQSHARLLEALKECAKLFEVLDGVSWTEESDILPETYAEAATLTRAAIASAQLGGLTQAGKETT